MKSLYITFIPIINGNGISKKIKAQQQAFINCGMDMELSHIEIRDKIKYYVIGSSEFRLGNKFVAKIRAKLKYNLIYDYVISEGIKFAYIRYTSEASANYINFLRALKQAGVKIILEIPTYPYDGELRPRNLYESYLNKRERYYRKFLFKYIDCISTFSSDQNIYGVECINISNAIDFNEIALRTYKPNHNYVKFVAVATLAFWHGYDRMIKAISEYYKIRNNKVLVYFDIVGEGPAYNDLRNQVAKLNIGEYVKFHGRREGEELTKIFNDADICVGSLARHRSGIQELKALKNVEYAVRGIPFIYSEINPDFEGREYIYKITPDESPIDISKIINTLLYSNFDAQNIRDSISYLSWDNQMKLVVDYLIKI